MTEQDEKLLRMAGEIYQFFRHQGDAAPVAAASHLKQFWAPSMRADYLAVDCGQRRSGECAASRHREGVARIAVV